MAFTVKIKMDLPKATEIIAGKGLGESGHVQCFHTQNVLRRIEKYMPFKTGTLRKQMIAATDINKPVIVVPGPAARFLYHGKLMLGDVTNSAWAKKDETKHEVEKDLDFNREKSPQAGPYWDRALMANEKAALTRDLQAHIDRNSGGGR